MDEKVVIYAKTNYFKNKTTYGLSTLNRVGIHAKNDTVFWALGDYEKFGELVEDFKKGVEEYKINGFIFSFNTTDTLTLDIFKIKPEDSHHTTTSLFRVRPLNEIEKEQFIEAFMLLAKKE